MPTSHPRTLPCPRRSVGITAPILPGVMPVMTYGGFKRMTAFCKTAVPQHIADTLEAIKGSDDAVKARQGRNTVFGLVAGFFLSAHVAGTLEASKGLDGAVGRRVIETMVGAEPPRCCGAPAPPPSSPHPLFYSPHLPTPSPSPTRPTASP